MPAPATRTVPDDPLAAAAALHRDSPLQRFQRDIQAAQQHGMIAFHGFEGIGRELLARNEG